VLVSSGPPEKMSPFSAAVLLALTLVATVCEY
jgi:hypothetical protein